MPSVGHFPELCCCRFSEVFFRVVALCCAVLAADFISDSQQRNWKFQSSHLIQLPFLLVAKLKEKILSSEYLGQDGFIHIINQKLAFK